jgi:hypothetical protein
MARHRLTLALPLAVLAVAAAGCGSNSSTPDSDMVRALNLTPAGQGYEVGDDPFCVVGELLNDGDEVDGASGDQQESFVIASPNGEIGIVALKPFPPDCAQQARKDLRRLARRD